jgi:hypothetical protein
MQRPYDHHFNWIRGQGAGPRVGLAATEQQRKFEGYRSTLRGHSFWFIYNALPAELDAYVLCWLALHMHKACTTAISFFQIIFSLSTLLTIFFV